MTEYGRVSDTKNGWNTRRLAGDDTPIPVVDDTANALAYQVVRVSGTFASIIFLPVNGLRENSNSKNQNFSDFIFSFKIVTKWELYHHSLKMKQKV